MRIKFIKNTGNAEEIRSRIIATSRSTYELNSYIESHKNQSVYNYIESKTHETSTGTSHANIITARERRIVGRRKVIEG